MARTITIDHVGGFRLQVVGDGAGGIQVYAEYTLFAGSQPIRRVHEEVSTRLSGARQSQLKALFEAVSGDLVAQELS